MSDDLQFRELTLAVVGVDYPNRKRAYGNRRYEILLCHPGETIHLVPEDDNPEDPNAVAVFTDRGTMLGYIRAERAPYVRLELGRDTVTAIFQSSEEWGANIRVGFRGVVPTLPAVVERKKADPDEWLYKDPIYDE